MNLIDIMIIITMIFLVVRGIFRGFFMEIASLAGVVLGFILAYLYHPQVADLIKSNISSIDGFALQLISFAIIFAVVLIFCNIAGWGLKRIIKKMFLGWADRGLGAGLAVLKGVIITYMVIVILTFIPPMTSLVAKSRLAPFIISSYQSMITFVSPNSYQNWKKRFTGGKQDIDRTKTNMNTPARDGS